MNNVFKFQITNQDNKVITYSSMRALLDEIDHDKLPSVLIIKLIECSTETKCGIIKLGQAKLYNLKEDIKQFEVKGYDIAKFFVQINPKEVLYANLQTIVNKYFSKFKIDNINDVIEHMKSKNFKFLDFEVKRYAKNKDNRLVSLYDCLLCKTVYHNQTMVEFPVLDQIIKLNGD